MNDSGVRMFQAILDNSSQHTLDITTELQIDLDDGRCSFSDRDSVAAETGDNVGQDQAHARVCVRPEVRKNVLDKLERGMLHVPVVAGLVQLEVEGVEDLELGLGV